MSQETLVAGGHSEVDESESPSRDWAWEEEFGEEFAPRTPRLVRQAECMYFGISPPRSPSPW